jgi:prepilin-type N-terminal cleavage/methylation domain-containing protein
MKRGFTLIEIMVAAVVCTIFFTGVYRIYRAVTSSMKRSQWSLKAQQHAQNGLNFLREEMQRASYKSMVKINETKIEAAGYEFYLANSFPITTDQELAHWSICVPIPNSDSAILRSSLKLQGGQILYSRTGDTKAPQEKPFVDKPLISDVATVSVTLEEFDPAMEVPGTLIKMQVAIRHPDRVNFPYTYVEAQTGAKVEVEVKQGL